MAYSHHENREFTMDCFVDDSVLTDAQSSKSGELSLQSRTGQRFLRKAIDGFNQPNTIT
jgi:hypothetical protein